MRRLGETMEKRLNTLLLTALTAACLSMSTGCKSEEAPTDEPAAAQTSAAASEKPVYPRPIIHLSPPPGAEICLPHSIDVRFKLNDSMILNGRHDETAFDMFLDGKSIKREVEFFPSQSFPQTHVALLHAMWVYDPGPHTARVEFIGDDGDTGYEWQFTIKEDCPKPNM